MVHCQKRAKSLNFSGPSTIVFVVGPLMAPTPQSSAAAQAAEHHCAHDVAADAEGETIVTSRLDYGARGRRLSIDRARC